MTTCDCLSDDAGTARKAPLDTRRTLLDTSHFSVGVRACPECGQLFLHVFMELIDWQGGDDSQASVRIPVSAAEAGELPRFATALDAELALRARDFRRRKLWWVWPRGGEASTYWADGELVILPHD